MKPPRFNSNHPSHRSPEDDDASPISPPPDSSAEAARAQADNALAAEAASKADSDADAEIPSIEEGLTLLPPRPRRVGRLRAETSAAAMKAVTSFSSLAAIAPFFTFLLAALLILAASVTLTPGLHAEDYPFRSKYPEEKIYWSEDMRKNWDSIIPIDVRGAMEYDVLRIEHARHMPLATLDEKSLLKFRAKTTKAPRPIVFYATNSESEAPYIAAQRARLAGYENVYVYDNGVLRWAENWPERTRFFGELLTAKDAKEKLIPYAEYKKINLDPAVFLHASRTGEYHIFDLRSLPQREEIRFYFTGQQTASVDMFLQLLKREGVVPKENLLIYDWDGTRTEALQYFLRNQGITKYYFLKGGLVNLVASGLIPKT
ncbi:MAG: rhodanese-like domain-containing protein [Candidatus Methylacidiphilales bacterium]|nr:rhodanese-like domain-containing protein [Candidatus Methylacidiphilales bacterium]